MTNENVKRVALNPTDIEYQDVEKNVRATCQTTVNQIVKVIFVMMKCIYLNNSI